MMFKYLISFFIVVLVLGMMSCGEAYENERFKETKYYVEYPRKFDAEFITGKDTLKKLSQRPFFKMERGVEQIIIHDDYFNHLDSAKMIYFYSDLPLSAVRTDSLSTDAIQSTQVERGHEISLVLQPKLNTKVRYTMLNQNGKRFCFAEMVHEFDRKYMNYNSVVFKQNLIQGNLPFIRMMGLGAFLILALYHLMIFIKTRQRIYLFYTIFVFSNFIYFFKYLPWTSMFTYFEQNAWLYFLFLIVTCGQILTYIFYNIFISVYFDRFLKDKSNYALGLKLIRLYIAISIILFFILFFLYYSDQWDTAFLVYNGYRILAMIFGVYINIYFIRRWNSSVAYIVIGGGIIVVGGILSWFSAAGVMFQDSYLESLDFLLFASLLEVLVFSLGLGKQVVATEKEKNLNHQKLINQLKENEKLQTVLNQGLERQLNLELEVSKLAKFEKQLMSAELSALKSQMNPHFLFNSLNSLKLVVLEKEPALAAKYLDQFAKLYRKILNNSRQKLVTIEEEMDLLKLYIQAEAIRFKNEIYVQIELGDNFDASFTKIPPMLLQPIVENAIWHGLRNKESDDHCLIFKFDLLERDGQSILKISIEDNGVGRSPNTSKEKVHKSLATKIIKERLELLEKVHSIKCSFDIIDLKDATDKPRGTRVELELPGEL